MARDNVFMKITNKDIYDEIQSLKRLQQSQHEEVISRQDKTNGKVRLATKIGMGAMGLAVILLGLLFEHVKR